MNRFGLTDEVVSSAELLLEWHPCGACGKLVLTRTVYGERLCRDCTWRIYKELLKRTVELRPSSAATVSKLKRGHDTALEAWTKKALAKTRLSMPVAHALLPESKERRSGGVGAYFSSRDLAEHLGTDDPEALYGWLEEPGSDYDPLERGWDLEGLGDYRERMRKLAEAAFKRRERWKQQRHRGGVVKTHCIYGHELAGENLYVHPKTGKHSCKQCDRRRGREYRARKRKAALQRD